jgi:predicted metal-dependent hydrolase
VAGRSDRGRREIRAARSARTVDVSILRSEADRVALERTLQSRLGAPVELELTDNTYTMISFSRRRGVFCLRLHHMFLRAEEEVVAALANYVRGDDRRASALLDNFIHDHRRKIRQISPVQRQRRLPLQTRGRVHDLEALLEEVRATSFGDLANDVAIAWAPAPPVRLPRRTIKLGSYSADTQIIRIHPALDQLSVPDFFIRWIIHHELVHHVFRADLKARNGRVHTPAFMRLERQFPELREAILWERRNLDLLLWWQPVRKALRPTGT